MCSILELNLENMNVFWKEHIQYLFDDIKINDEDKAYFQSDEYRNVIQQHMLRPIDTHHVIYFMENGVKIGASQYCTYKSEDGKCFLLDFWIFPEYRGNGTGHKCFAMLEEYTKADGAIYFQLNATKDDSIRFWKSIGFVEIGIDEYGVKLFAKH